LGKYCQNEIVNGLKALGGKVKDFLAGLEALAEAARSTR
jgi:hypothetical protein